MATEKNPYDQIPQEAPPSVIPEVSETELDATFEVEDDGGVVVDFASEVEEEVSMVTLEIVEYSIPNGQLEVSPFPRSLLLYGT